MASCRGGEYKIGLEPIKKNVISLTSNCKRRRVVAKPAGYQHSNFELGGFSFNTDTPSQIRGKYDTQDSVPVKCFPCQISPWSVHHVARGGTENHNLSYLQIQHCSVASRRFLEYVAPPRPMSCNTVYLTAWTLCHRGWQLIVYS